MTQEKDDGLQTNFGAPSGFSYRSPGVTALGDGDHEEGITGGNRGPNTNCATCSWEKLTMLNPQLVAGKHVFFGDHESEDIQTGNRVRIHS